MEEFSEQNVRLPDVLARALHNTAQGNMKLATAARHLADTGELLP